MPITVKHTKVSTIPDDANTDLVRPSDWNADHTLTGLGTMAEQNANAVAITGGTINGTTIGATSATTGAFTTATASTSVASPVFKPTSSAGGALQNAGGTNQLQWGSGGGNNVSVDVAININPANAQVDLSPTGTGVVRINPATAGTMNNMVIGGTTPLAGSFTDLSVTGTTSFDGSQGTAGQVLTSQGTGNTPTWTTASGGITGFTSGENTTAPNATVYVDFLQASASVTNADVAFIAKGTGATLAQVPTSTAAGGNKRGASATDWQKVRDTNTQVASGSQSVIVGGANNTASGNNTFIGGGDTNIASANFSLVGGGFGNTASTTVYSTVVNGNSNQATGQYAAILNGASNVAGGANSSVINGRQATTRSIVAYNVFSPTNSFVNVGGAQSAFFVLTKGTTNATPAVLVGDTSAPSNNNQLILPNNSAYYFTGEIISGVTGGGNTKGFTIEGVIKRGANAASTTLVGSTVVSTFGDAGAATWTIALTADTSNGGLAITFTGQASTTIRTVAQVRTTEMSY